MMIVKYTFIPLIIKNHDIKQLNKFYLDELILKHSELNQLNGS